MGLPQLNVPRYQVKLPSTGEIVNMRPYLVKEEKVLMIALESNDIEQITTAVRNIIMSCYDLPSLNELTVFDIEYLFLQLRAKSVGEKIQLQVKCTAESEEECKGLTPIVIDINDIEILNADMEKTIMLDEELGIGVEMRFPSMDMLENLNFEKLDSIEGIMDLIILCIDSIFDKDNRYDTADSTKEELENFVDGLSGEQFKKIQLFFTNVPAVYYKTNYACEKCGTDNILELKGLNNFFS